MFCFILIFGIISVILLVWLICMKVFGVNMLGVVGLVVLLLIIEWCVLLFVVGRLKLSSKLLLVVVLSDMLSFRNLWCDMFVLVWFVLRSFCDMLGFFCGLFDCGVNLVVCVVVVDVVGYGCVDVGVVWVWV